MKFYIFISLMLMCVSSLAAGAKVAKLEGNCKLENAKLICNGQDYAGYPLQVPAQAKLENVTELKFDGPTLCALNPEAWRCWTYGNVVTFSREAHFEFGSIFYCVLDRQKLRCLRNSNGIDLSKFTKVQEVAVSEITSQIQGCVIDDNQIKCFSEDAGESIKAPVLANPRGLEFVRTSKYLYCATSGEVRHCWGKEKEFQFKKVRQIVREGDEECVLSEAGVECTTEKYYFARPTGMSFKDMKKVGVSKDAWCAINDTNLDCWNAYDLQLRWGQEYNNPALKFLNIQNLVVYDFAACALENGEIHCATRYALPSFSKLTSVKDMVGGGNHFCAWIEKSVKCWKWDWQQKETYSFFGEDVQQLVQSGNLVCVLDRIQGVVCADGSPMASYLAAPELKNPTYLVQHPKFGICVLHEDGVKCLSARGKFTDEAPAYRTGYDPYVDSLLAAKVLEARIYRHDALLLKFIQSLFREGIPLKERMLFWSETYQSSLKLAYLRTPKSKIDFSEKGPLTSLGKSVVLRVLIESIRTSQSLLNETARASSQKLILDLSSYLGNESPINPPFVKQLESFFLEIDADPYLQSRLPLQLELLKELGN